MKPLFIPLKTEYFNQFADGSKFVEYRLNGPRWNSKTVVNGRKAILSHGYSGKRIIATVMGFEIIKNTITNIYPNDAELIAIHLDIQN